LFPNVLREKLNGPFKDYVPEWYGNVGLTILKTMVINAIMPLINIVKGFAIPMIKQKLDSKFTDDIYKTKCTSMAKYRAIYGGTDYLIHFKYSDALNITYITCMYGIGIPVLFPVAAMNLGLTLISERIATAYYVKLPPAMDDTMTKNTLRLLKLAPIMLLFNSYWMVGNK